MKVALNTIKEERSKLWMDLDSIAMPVLLFNAQVSFPKTITLQSYFYTKIIILGDNEVGKSSLISTFCYGLNDISKIKAATHHRKDITIDDIHIQMDIFDTAGNMIISLFLIHKRELD